MLAPLDNETIFKRAFTNKEVFQLFIKDLFDVDITVDKIETEKKFIPPIADINIELDIYAESTDHRFVIEIQKIDYDYNFNRFLNYFISLLIEQQKKATHYKIPQTVLGVVVLTRPYKIDQLTGEPIKESVMSIDFDPRNLKNERVNIWKHQLLFLNPNPNYKNADTPRNYQDWLDLLYASINEQKNYKLNLKNKGVAKTIDLIEFENLDPDTLEIMKIEESKKEMLELIKKEERKEQEEKHHREKLKIAKNFLNAGVAIDVIVNATGLSKQEIEKLK